MSTPQPRKVGTVQVVDRDETDPEPFPAPEVPPPAPQQSHEIRAMAAVFGLSD